MAAEFDARPSIDGDEQYWFNHAYASPGNEDWVHSVNSRNVAQSLIRLALDDRSLAVWVRLTNDEAKADSRELIGVNHRTISTGIFSTIPRVTNLEGRPLWIKKTDWNAFCDRVLRQRYGETVTTYALASEPTASLLRWVALEVRRSRSNFDAERKAQDHDFEARGLRKSGVRVKALLKLASEIGVRLADATIAKVAEFSPSQDEVDEARVEVEKFTRDMVLGAVALAHFVSSPHQVSVGRAAVQAAIERGEKLQADVSGAFDLLAHGRQVDSVASDLVAIWQAEARRAFEKQRDEINGRVGLAGNTLGSAHVLALCDAVEQCAGSIIVQARALPMAPPDYAALRTAALATFNELHATARRTVGQIGSSVNGELADRLASEARSRLTQTVIKWRLEDRLRTEPVEPATKATPSPKRRGRPPGSGSMANADAGFFAEMQALIDAGKAFSPNEAAGILMNRLPGRGSPENRARRLADRFRAGQPKSD